MNASSTQPTPSPIHQTMGELLSLYPGARRTLFQRYHLGGCNSCSFSLEETLSDLCARNEGLDPIQVLQEIEASHLEDAKLLITPVELYTLLHDTSTDALHLIDLRTREEFEAVHIPTSQLLTEELMQQLLATAPKEELVILIDHLGERVLDAAAYFAGHSFSQVKALQGGIDAYAEKTDSALPRYTIEEEKGGGTSGCH